MMDFKEEMKSKREEFWKEVIKNTNIKIEKYLKDYQEKLDEFVSNSYNVKLVASLDENAQIDIYCMINDDEICKDLYTVTWFKTYDAVRYYLELVSLNLPKDKFSIIRCASEFSKEELVEKGECIILESIFELK